MRKGYEIVCHSTLKKNKPLFLARFLQWSLGENLSPEVCLLKSLLPGPLNRTGKAGSCPTQNNFIEL